MRNCAEAISAKIRSVNTGEKAEVRAFGSICVGYAARVRSDGLGSAFCRQAFWAGVSSGGK